MATPYTATKGDTQIEWGGDLKHPADPDYQASQADFSDSVTKQFFIAYYDEKYDEAEIGDEPDAAKEYYESIKNQSSATVTFLSGIKTKAYERVGGQSITSDIKTAIDEINIPGDNSLEQLYQIHLNKEAVDPDTLAKIHVCSVQRVRDFLNIYELLKTEVKDKEGKFYYKYKGGKYLDKEDKEITDQGKLTEMRLAHKLVRQDPWVLYGKQGLAITKLFARPFDPSNQHTTSKELRNYFKSRDSAKSAKELAKIKAEHMARKQILERNLETMKNLRDVVADIDAELPDIDCGPDDISFTYIRYRTKDDKEETTTYAEWISEFEDKLSERTAALEEGKLGRKAFPKDLVEAYRDEQYEVMMQFNFSWREAIANAPDDSSYMKLVDKFSEYHQIKAEELGNDPLSSEVVSAMKSVFISDKGGEFSISFPDIDKGQIPTVIPDEKSKSVLAFIKELKKIEARINKYGEGSGLKTVSPLPEFTSINHSELVIPKDVMNLIANKLAVHGTREGKRAGEVFGSGQRITITYDPKNTEKKLDIDKAGLGGNLTNKFKNDASLEKVLDLLYDKTAKNNPLKIAIRYVNGTKYRERSGLPVSLNETWSFERDLAKQIRRFILTA